MKIITSISPVFERDLQRGMKHPDVKRLQQLLNLDPETQVAKTGDGSPGQEIDVYGPRTEDAVRRFQAKHGVESSGTPATTGYGRLGKKTRKAIIEAYEYKPVTDKSKIDADELKEAPNKIPPRAREALEWARDRMGDFVQPCDTSGCLYNPNQRGGEACQTPERDEKEIKKGNHKDFHCIWLFWCARFVQNAFGIQQQRENSAIDIYHKLRRQGLVNESNDVPEGALVFWDLTKYGHVGICSGNGNIIHTGTKKHLKEEGIREDPISQISKKRYLGWAHVPTDWL